LALLSTQKFLLRFAAYRIRVLAMQFVFILMILFFPLALISTPFLDVRGRGYLYVTRTCGRVS